MTNEMMDSLEAKQVSEVFCVKVFAFVRCTIVFANYCGSVWSLGAARALKKEFFKIYTNAKKKFEQQTIFDWFWRFEGKNWQRGINQVF